MVTHLGPTNAMRAIGAQVKIGIRICIILDLHHIRHIISPGTLGQPLTASMQQALPCYD